MLEERTETRPIRAVILQSSNVGPRESLWQRDRTLVASCIWTSWHLDFMAFAFIWGMYSSASHRPSPPAHHPLASEGL